ncbi:MAG: hypothetical protein RR615_01745 [Morganella sp. (in: enterobacteria)]
MNTAIDNVYRFPGREPEERPVTPESSGKGFALIHRKMKELPFYKTDSDAVHLWIHFILSANHAAGTVLTEFGEVLCRRGEFITGRNTLAFETGIDPNRIKYLILKFEKLGMISKESNKKFSKIFIVKYDDYQQKIVPTECHQSAIANLGAPTASAEVVPTECHQSATNNNILNTNVFNDRPGITKSSPRKVKPDSAVSSPKGDKWGTADDLKAAQWIFQLITRISPSAKTPNWSGWANDVRLMREQDNRTHSDICQMFQFANRDSFWKSNVLSPAKLREKWTQLEAKRNTQGESRSAGRQQLDYNNTDWAEGLKI